MTNLTTTPPPVDAQLATVVDMAVNAVDSEHTRRAYRRALIEFTAWFIAHPQPFNRAAVNNYKAQLQQDGTTDASINQRLSAIRKLAKEAEANGWIDANTARGIVEVEGIAQRGTRAGNWLTIEEASALLNAPDDSTLKGKRDRALLAVLIGAGLRREEMQNLTVEHLQQREGRWCIVDIRGKRNKVRTVPIAAWTKALIDRWLQAAGIASGPVFALVTRGANGKVLANKTTSQSIMRAVMKYAEQIGKPVIRPHDLRRTYAKLARAGGAPLEQIQINLGHDSLTTTQKYLGADLDYQSAPADVIKLNVRFR